MNPKPPISDEEVQRSLKMLTTRMNAPPRRVAQYSFCPSPTPLTLGTPLDFEIRGKPQIVLGKVKLSTNAPCRDFVFLDSVRLDNQEVLTLPIDAFIRLPETVEVDEDEPFDAVLEDGTRVTSIETPFLRLHQTIAHEIVVRGRYSGWVPDGAHRAGEVFPFTVMLLGVGRVP